MAETGHGLDVLLSFAYHSNTDIAAMRAAIGPRHQVVLDSGAFTAHTRGKQVNIDDYAAWLIRWKGTYDYAVTLDVIGDPTGTDRNTHELHDAGFDVVPVFTVGDPPAKLDRLAAEGHPLVYVGGLVGQRRKVMRPYLCAVTARARQAGIAVHALGVGGVEALNLAGCYSGDSSSATQSPAFGSVCVWTGSSLRQIKVSDKKELSKHRDWLAGLDMPFTDMITGNVFGKGQRSVRDQIVRAGLWAFVAANAALRNIRSIQPPGLIPGPRILAAVSTGDIPLAMEIGRAARSNPPPSITRIRPPKDIP